MFVQCIRSLSEMQALEGEWNALLARSARNVPFLRYEYQSTWWQTLGGGEWPQGELLIVTARQEDGELIGIAPFFFTQNREGEPALMFIGSIEISDYLDVIAPPDHLAPFLEGVLDCMAQCSTPGWKVLDLYNLVDASPTLPLLQQFARKRGFSFSQEPLQHCPYIALPGDWETYLAGIDKKQRHEIRRKLRRSEEYIMPVHWRIAENGAGLDSEINAFLDLMTHDPEKRAFFERNEKIRPQMFLTAKAAAKAGWLQLAFVEVGGEKAAGYMNFDYENQIWVYNSGFDPKYRELSLGWVLLARLLQWAIEHKRASFDFMRGDEDYKYRFGAVDRRVVRAVLRR